MTIDQSLISGAKDDTSAMIFWLKTKADFLRYQTEFFTDSARTHTPGQAVQCYEEASSPRESNSRRQIEDIYSF
jgi:hypothetical protein